MLPTDTKGQSIFTLILWVVVFIIAGALFFFGFLQDQIAIGQQTHEFTGLEGFVWNNIPLFFILTAILFVIIASVSLGASR